MKALLFSLAADGLSKHLRTSGSCRFFPGWGLTDSCLWVLRINDTTSLFTFQSSFSTPENKKKKQYCKTFLKFCLFCGVFFFLLFCFLFLYEHTFGCFLYRP